MQPCIPASKSLINAFLPRYTFLKRIGLADSKYVFVTCGNLITPEFQKKSNPCIYPFASTQFRCAHGMLRPRSHREKREAWPRERFEKPQRRVEMLRDLDFAFHPMFPPVGGRWAGWGTHWERAKQRILEAREEELRQKRTSVLKRLKKDDDSNDTADTKQQKKTFFKCAWGCVRKIFKSDVKK